MSPEQNWYLREFVETVRYELGQQSAPSTLHLDGFPEPGPETVYVLVAPHEYVALEGEGALPDDEILRRTILLCAQPPDALDPDGGAEMLRRAGAVFDINARSVAALRRAGIPARHLRPGYSKLRDVFDPEAEREIDVMFLGSHTLHRTRQLSRCARLLARHNCLLQLSDASHPNTGGSSSFIAEGKSDLLKRTKIILNVHRGADTYLEWLRVLDAIHAGAVVVTEQSNGLSPLVSGEHLLVAGPESLPYVLEAALRDDDRLRRLRSQAYEQIRSMLPFARSVSVLRAAAVEIVGRSVSMTASRGRRTASLLDPWATLSSLDGAGEAAATRRELTQVRVEMIELRREIARLEQLVRSGSDAPKQIDFTHNTPAWSPHRESRVTVITALSDDAQVALATIDSVANSSFRDFELVVVDDASTHESVDVLREWMRLNPRIPALLVRHAAARGVGAARNTALEFARAGYCLTLSPGDELYPRCLEVLVWTLDAMPDAAFAYPILEVFGMTEAFVEAGGDYLLDFFGWEPRRLRVGTRVAALALFRTGRLRRLGGFATEPELSGWEDYDLWCRVAERGWRGQLVPQSLGRYRATLTGPAGTAALSRRPPVSALLERAPRLLAGVPAA